MSASAFAAAANAQAVGSVSTIDGAGSSLLAPYWAQATHCYDSVNTSYYVKGTPVTVATDGAVSCTPLTAGQNAVNFDSTGSGSGIGALFAHTYVAGTAQQTEFASLLGTAPGSTTTPAYPLVNYGLSDNSLIAADVTIYNNGGTEQGVTVVAPGGTVNTATPTFANPKATYGALVQFPVSVDPVALAYNPVYKSSNGNTYSFNIQTPNADGSGGLKLSAAAYCGIFTGAITDWGSSTLTALNGGVSLKATTDTGTSAPIIIVGRSDSSGTTSIFTRHLAAVCGSSAYTAGVTTLPTAVQSLYTLASGSGGVATAIHNAPGAIGYIGPDYALPAVVNTGANTYGLNVADLQNSTAAGGAFEEPLPAAATAAFSSLSPPTGASRSDPTAWVQSTASTAPLANPQASGSYPIVGTTNFLGYTCYASLASVTELRNYLTFGGTSAAQTILSNAGLAPLPNTTWGAAISSTFVTPSGSATGLNLFFAQAGTGSNGVGNTNSTCTASGVTGG
jgi:ABC-type phosphate transport system substrate-binding protein